MGHVHPDEPGFLLQKVHHPGKQTGKFDTFIDHEMAPHVHHNLWQLFLRLTKFLFDYCSHDLFVPISLVKHSPSLRDH
jgi:hypothetical protein